MRRPCVVILVALCLLIVAPAATQQPRVLGLVLGLTPPVYLRPSARGPDVSLDPATDLARPLYEGEAIRSGPGGRAYVAIGGDRPITIDAPRGWVAIVAPPQDEAPRRLAALGAYGRPGGTRGFGARLFSPADQSVVRSGALDVRWTPQPGERLVRAELRTATGRVIWSVDDQPATTGRLEVRVLADLRRALREAERGQVGLDAWVVAVRADRGGIGASTFHTLALDQERAWTQESRLINQETDSYLRAILEAHLCATFGLLNEAAEGFERILMRAPRSEALLRATMAAQAATGNLPRVEELRARVATLR